ncbi:hypothetical protein HU200_018104 [Digitaria exilis]|uniref:RRM domain-containing protein n=1 Tax=Digitaria exilis TaxID=1010633 RepID=A0A835KF16_9POAL|nr:hypothetical protein HU200_018104 [Digitaria exilis]
MVSASAHPSTTYADAPRNWSPPSRTMAAADALFMFFDIAASTLIFIKPTGGGIHRVVFGTFTLFAICSVLVMPRSAIYLSTKRCVVIGLWKESSWIAFRLTYQMDHKVVATLMKPSLDRVSIADMSQSYALVSWMQHKCSTTSSLSSAQMHLARWRSINECFHESLAPQIPHLSCVDILWWCRTSTDGIEARARRHTSLEEVSRSLRRGQAQQASKMAQLVVSHNAYVGLGSSCACSACQSKWVEFRSIGLASSGKPIYNGNKNNPCTTHTLGKSAAHSGFFFFFLHSPVVHTPYPQNPINLKPPSESPPPLPMAATLFSTSLSPQFLSLSAKPAPAAASATAAFPSVPPPQLRALTAASAAGWRPLAPVRAAAAVAEELDAEGKDGGEEEVVEEFSADLRVFVGNLPFSVDSAQLAGLFEQAGSVEMVEVCVCVPIELSIRRPYRVSLTLSAFIFVVLLNKLILPVLVIYDKLTGRSRGFGFVTMSSVEEAEAAVEQFNGYVLEGRSLRVNSGPAPPRDQSSPRGSRGEAKRVYVGNLSWGVDNTALANLFKEQGEVLEARVIYDRESGRSRGFGFVTFASDEEVENAISNLDGADLDGRQIRVTVAESRPPRQQNGFLAVVSLVLHHTTPYG